jgi:hypothetical protein
MAKSKSRRAKRIARSFVRDSRFRFGRLQARGVPSILLGVSALVLAAGASTALRKAATLLPETLREARHFWLAVREPRLELPR